MSFGHHHSTFVNGLAKGGVLMASQPVGQASSNAAPWLLTASPLRQAGIHPCHPMLCWTTSLSRSSGIAKCVLTPVFACFGFLC